MPPPDHHEDPLREEYRHAVVDHPRRETFFLQRDIALTCIDLQYLDAARGEGVFAEGQANGVDPQAQEYYFDRLEHTVLPNTHRLQQCFRERGLEVVHCRICALTRDGRDRSTGHKLLGLLAPPGSREAEILPQVAPVDDEIVINKTTSGIFTSTNMHYVLRNIGIRSLYLAGVYTNECVETTARDACDRGYFVTIVEDACATVTPELHQASLQTLRDRYARIATTAEILAELEQLPEASVAKRA